MKADGSATVKFSREWAMPNSETFKVPPIRSLVRRYVGTGFDWIDPFAGNNSPAEFTNDLNPDTRATEHMKAIDYCRKMPGPFRGAIIDPPYSPRQIAEVYANIGIGATWLETSAGLFSGVKAALTPKILPGGIAISCMWNSGGFGKGLGFEIVEIMLVCHGGNHNDTIVTVERKAQEQIQP
jgi:hypothetical protein